MNRNTSNKTELVAEKISLETDRAWSALLAAHGVLIDKGRSKSDKEWADSKRKAGREYFAMIEKRFNRK